MPEEAREAARGLGYGEGRLLLRVELPLAVPVLVAGLRVAIQGFGKVAGRHRVQHGQFDHLHIRGSLSVDSGSRSLAYKEQERWGAARVVGLPQRYPLFYAPAPRPQ